MALKITIGYCALMFALHILLWFGDRYLAKLERELEESKRTLERAKRRAEWLDQQIMAEKERIKQ